MAGWVGENEEREIENEAENVGKHVVLRCAGLCFCGPE